MNVSLSCNKCNKPLLVLFYNNNEYKQLESYYFQIENKEITTDENDVIEVYNKEYYVCEICHSPKLLEAVKKISCKKYK